MIARDLEANELLDQRGRSDLESDRHLIAPSRLLWRTAHVPDLAEGLVQSVPAEGAIVTISMTDRQVHPIDDRVNSA